MSFLQSKMCEPEKSASGAQFVQAWYSKLKVTKTNVLIFKKNKNKKQMKNKKEKK